MKRLELNFEKKLDESTLSTMITKMKKASPVEFTHETGAPNLRKVFSKPEYMNIKFCVWLIFSSDADAKEFMATPECREIYDAYVKAFC